MMTHAHILLKLHVDILNHDDISLNVEFRS